jgi:hypothetical protein
VIGLPPFGPTFCVAKPFSAIALTSTLLMWRIWWVPNNTSGLQMGFNSIFKGLIKTRLPTVEIGFDCQYSFTKNREAD